MRAPQFERKFKELDVDNSGYLDQVTNIARVSEVAPTRTPAVVQSLMKSCTSRLRVDALRPSALKLGALLPPSAFKLGAAQDELHVLCQWVYVSFRADNAELEPHLVMIYISNYRMRHEVCHLRPTASHLMCVHYCACISAL